MPSSHLLLYQAWPLLYQGYQCFQFPTIHFLRVFDSILAVGNIAATNGDDDACDENELKDSHSSQL